MFLPSPILFLNTIEMNWQLRFIIVFLSLLFVNPRTYGSLKTLDYTPHGIYDITDSVEFARLPQTPFTNSEEQAKFVDPRTLTFQKLPSNKDINFSYTNDIIWLKTTLQNVTNQEIEAWLILDATLTGRIDFFVDQNSTLAPLGVSGSNVPFSMHIEQLRRPSLHLRFSGGEIKTVYLKRLSQHHLAARMQIADLKSAMSREAKEDLFYFFYMGAALLLVFYNFMIFIYSKERAYIYYSLFGLFFATTLFSLSGVLDKYIFSDLALSQYLIVFSSLANLFSCLFGRRILHVRDNFKYFNTVTLILIIVSGAHAVLGLIFVPLGISAMLGPTIDLTIGATCLVLLSLGIIGTIRKHIIARFYLFSWTIVLLAALSWFLMQWGVFSRSLLIEHSLFLGGLFEMVTLSLALAYKIAILDQQRREAQEHAEQGQRYHRLVKVLIHDVANRVSMIQGQVRMLLRRSPSEETKTTLDRIFGIATNISTNLQSVKSEEVLASYKENLKLEPVVIQNAVELAKEVVQDQLETKNIQLVLKLDPNLRIKAERTSLINQVLVNLLTNAIKFSDEGSQIIIESECKNGFACIKIQDNGIGMSAENLARVYNGQDLFSTLGTKGEHGTGFGISLVKDYMNLYQGEIRVHSVERVKKEEATFVSQSDQTSSASSGTLVELKFLLID